VFMVVKPSANLFGTQSETGTLRMGVSLADAPDVGVLLGAEPPSSEHADIDIINADTSRTIANFLCIFIPSLDKTRREGTPR